MGSADAVCVSLGLFANGSSWPFGGSPGPPAKKTFVGDDRSPSFAGVAGSPALDKGAIGSSGATETARTLGRGTFGSAGGSPWFVGVAVGSSGEDAGLVGHLKLSWARGLGYLVPNLLSSLESPLDP